MSILTLWDILESIDLTPGEEFKDIHAPILVGELINDAPIDVHICMCYISGYKQYKCCNSKWYTNR